MDVTPVVVVDRDHSATPTRRSRTRPRHFIANDFTAKTNGIARATSACPLIRNAILGEPS